MERWQGNRERKQGGKNWREKKRVQVKRRLAVNRKSKIVPGLRVQLLLPFCSILVLVVRRPRTTENNKTGRINNWITISIMSETTVKFYQTVTNFQLCAELRKIIVVGLKPRQRINQVSFYIACLSVRSTINHNHPGRFQCSLAALPPRSHWDQLCRILLRGFCSIFCSSKPDQDHFRSRTFLLPRFVDLWMSDFFLHFWASITDMKVTYKMFYFFF